SSGDGFSSFFFCLSDSNCGVHSFPTRRSSDLVALRLHPDQVELRISRAQSLALLGRYDSAAAELGVARDTVRVRAVSHASPVLRSEEHTSELQSRFDLVCRLLLEKKNPPAPRL